MRFPERIRAFFEGPTLREVSIVTKIPPMLPEGWDFADYVPAELLEAARKEARDLAMRYHDFILGRAARQYGIDANIAKLWQKEWDAAQRASSPASQSLGSPERVE